VLARKEYPSCGLMVVFLPSPLGHSRASPLYSLLSPYPEYYVVRPVGNPMICDANTDLSYHNNMFSMLGGNVDNFMSLCYFNHLTHIVCT